MFIALGFGRCNCDTQMLHRPIVEVSPTPSGTAEPPLVPTVPRETRELAWRQGSDSQFNSPKHRPALSTVRKENLPPPPATPCPLRGPNTTFASGTVSTKGCPSLPGLELLCCSTDHDRCLHVCVCLSAGKQLGKTGHFPSY